MHRIVSGAAVALLVVACAVVAFAGPGKRSPNGPFYSVVPDARLCPSPLCGGFFVSLVNRDTTRCTDRSRAAACYVVDIDWSRSGLDDAQIAELRSRGDLLVRGRLKRSRLEVFGSVGRLRAREAWAGVAAPGPRGPVDPPQAEGEVYARLRDNGVRCITAPCASFDMTPLNRRRKESRSIHEVDLSAVDASEAERQAAIDALATDQGLLALGRLEPFEVVLGQDGPVLTGVRFVASDFFLKGSPAPSR